MRFKFHCTRHYSGGPDCLHQLAGAVKRRGYYSAIVYPPFQIDGVLPYYKEIYDIHAVETRDENIDDPDTVQVFPAGWGPDYWPMSQDAPFCVKPSGNNPFKSTKIMYWLGFTEWQLWQNAGYDCPVDLHHPHLQKMYHACQSQFIYDYLIGSNLINSEQIFFVREHTVDAFLHNEEDIQKSLPHRKNIVLYNPAKGPQNANILIDVCKDIDCEFIPIQKMSHQEISELGMKSKVYIDFGPFPGREKIHREMAICGCTIITGSDGCSNNPIDVPSGSRKFARIGGHYDWIAVKKQIIWDLENHTAALDDLHMRYYRQSVREEKQRFENDVDVMIDALKNYGNLCGS